MSDNNDTRILLKAMEALADGNFEPIESDAFEDRSIAKAYNVALDKIVARNNRILTDVNMAMTKIGDSACIRSMFEEIRRNLPRVSTLQMTQTNLHVSLDSMVEHGEELQAISRMVRNTLDPCVEQLRELAGRLEAPNQADEGRSSEEAASVVLNRSMQELSGMSERLGEICNISNAVAEDIGNQYSELSEFVGSVGQMSASYQKLSYECMDTGRFFYGSARLVDDARNDMFRRNSRPSLHDCIEVFKVDHLVLTWRLYNNMVEFEALKHAQVDNPHGCKFGLWWDAQTDPVLTESAEFQRTMEYHEEFHRHAVACFEANAESNKPLAAEEFEHAWECYRRFAQSMTELHEYLNLAGYIEETKCWVYEG